MCVDTRFTSTWMNELALATFYIWRHSVCVAAKCNEIIRRELLNFFLIPSRTSTCSFLARFHTLKSIHNGSLYSLTPAFLIIAIFHWKKLLHESCKALPHRWIGEKKWEAKFNLQNWIGERERSKKKKVKMTWKLSLAWAEKSQHVAASNWLSLSLCNSSRFPLGASPHLVHILSSLTPSTQALSKVARREAKKFYHTGGERGSCRAENVLNSHQLIFPSIFYWWQKHLIWRIISIANWIIATRCQL